MFGQDVAGFKFMSNWPLLITVKAVTYTVCESAACDTNTSHVLVTDICNHCFHVDVTGVANWDPACQQLQVGVKEGSLMHDYKCCLS